MEGMILYLVYAFAIVTCTMSLLFKFTAHLLPVYRATYNCFMFAVMKTFVTDFSPSVAGIILYLVYNFGIVTCTMSPLFSFTAHILPVYRKQFRIFF